jgi:hypothetical protein
MIGLILKCGGLAYKSKCKKVEVCCLKIIRDTETEEKADEFIALHPPIPPSPSSKPLGDN